MPETIHDPIPRAEVSFFTLDNIAFRENVPAYFKEAISSIPTQTYRYLQHLENSSFSQKFHPIFIYIIIGLIIIALFH